MNKVGHPRLKGTALVSTVTSVCSFGFWLFGYEQGVMSGVVVSRPWLTQMGNPSTVMIGSVLMGSAFERIQMMVARVIAGIGIGYITSVAPVYQSEITPPEHRGWLVCCQSTGMLGGLMLGYWINYGFYFHSSSAQWRFPLLFQCIFAIYVIAVTLWLPETPRWLMQHDPTPDQGTTFLAKLRGVSSDHPAVQHERAEILDAISLEAKEEGSWSDLFKAHGIQGNKRFYLAISIQFLQELSGINIVTYYAPTLFQQSLGMSQERSLFLGCFLQVWYVTASFVTWYTIDRVGRRKLWISMACGQCLVLVLEAICVKMNTSQASIGAVFLIFVYESCFTWGWMATVWIYPPEILPLKLRAKGSALATAADFLGNFVISVTSSGFLNDNNGC
ncbi:general substrate transporter [Butyriboletus roseoflavus]|nr:general substrate transporter [Butyriboletus roseoflavus]